jgi:hypothetical protein
LADHASYAAARSSGDRVFWAVGSTAPSTTERTYSCTVIPLAWAWASTPASTSGLNFKVSVIPSFIIHDQSDLHFVRCHGLPTEKGSWAILKISNPQYPMFCATSASLVSRGRAGRRRSGILRRGTGMSLFLLAPPRRPLVLSSLRPEGDDTSLPGMWEYSYGPGKSFLRLPGSRRPIPRKCYIREFPRPQARDAHRPKR